MPLTFPVASALAQSPGGPGPLSVDLFDCGYVSNNAFISLFDSREKLGGETVLHFEYTTGRRTVKWTSSKIIRNVLVTNSS